jgi:4-amino-4-deoxy-L-arabinose transferase-like glycosyltransferase
MERIITSVHFKKFLILLGFIFLLGSYLPKIISDSGEKNLYVHQASAFIHGHLNIDQNLQDVAVYKSKFYVPFPPFPAVLLLPLVAVFGVSSTKVMFVSLILSVLSIFFLLKILKRLEIDSQYIVWIVAAFFLGTAYWSSSLRSSSVWFFAHIVAVTCMLVAINEVLWKGRGLLAGLFLGLAFLSRQMSIYAIFFLLILLIDRSSLKSFKWKVSNLLGFFFSLVLCVSLYLLFNWIRFDNIFNTGYSYIPLPGFLYERVARYGLFSPAYIPFNLLYMFIQGFHVEFSSATYLSSIAMDPFGTSITFASPFVFFAFWAKWKNKLLWGAWISISLMIFHTLLYYNNGYVQANAQRFTLDFLPIIIILVAFSLKSIPETIWKASVIYSIILNVLALSIIFLGTMGF